MIVEDLQAPRPAHLRMERLSVPKWDGGRHFGSPLGMRTMFLVGSPPSLIRLLGTLYRPKPRIRPNFRDIANRPPRSPNDGREIIPPTEILIDFYMILHG